MISLILIFPFIACLILFLSKSNDLNNLLITLYAIVHLGASMSLAMGQNYIHNYFLQSYFQVDSLNIIFLLILSVVFLAVAVYNIGYQKIKNLDYKNSQKYTMAVLFFILSMTAAILSNNLGLSWVFIEATTLTSAYLIYFNKTKHAIEAAWKYVFICSIGIAMAFVGIILLTIATGKLDSLFFEDLYQNAKLFNPMWLKLSFVFILFGIGTKMGLAPVHYWLPDAHSEAPSPISALLSATLLNSAFIVVLKVFKIMTLAGYSEYARLLLIIMGFLSLFVTAIFVYHINNYKRMLAYSSIENMGILAIGTALGGIGFFAALLHMIGHSLIKASFFLTSGNILEIFKTKRVHAISGINYLDPKTGWLWILSFIGILAFPPSVLFISEFLIIKRMVALKYYFPCVLFLLFLTIIIYGIGKAVIRMSFGEKHTDKDLTIKDNVKKISLYMYLPQVIMLIVAFVLGIYIPEILRVALNNATVGF